MEIYYQPLDKACKSRTGAIPRESELTLHVIRRAGGEDTACTLVLKRDGDEEQFFPMERTEDGWRITLRFHAVGLYFYDFRLGEERLVCGKLREGVLAKNPSWWQITVYDENYRTPDWFKGGVMYQIFPDRFYSFGKNPIADYKVMRNWGELPNYRPTVYGEVLNNDFFGGNLRGICKKLDYLQALGVNVIYLNPIFEAYSNHRYDTGDYMKIDPLLGTTEDFEALISAAAERGIRVILDGVFNHTGSDSRYFNQFGRYDSVGAYQSPDSPYADWYRFHPFPDDYDCWWGIRTLPAVNEASPSYQEFMFGENGVIKTWLRRGVGGYRLDVADELPDFFLKKLRAAVKEQNPDALIIGEVWEDASNKVAYDVRREYLQGAELDSVMNYPLKDAIIGFMLSGSTAQLREAIAMLIDNYPREVLHSLMNVLGTHDTPRILTVLGRKICTTKDEMAATWLSEDERKKALGLLKMAVVLQFTLPGVPCVYYGDENGMEGYSDPFCRRCFDWERLNEDLIGFYRKLSAIRREIFPNAFKDGDYREIYADSSCLVYERASASEKVYVFVNRSDCKYKISFEGTYREWLSGTDYTSTMVFDAQSYGIISKKQ